MELKGKVIAYCADANCGIIETGDRKHFSFTQRDWMSSSPPANNVDVLFDAGLLTAHKVRMAK